MCKSFNYLLFLFLILFDLKSSKIVHSKYHVKSEKLLFFQAISDRKVKAVSIFFSISDRKVKKKNLPILMNIYYFIHINKLQKSVLLSDGK